MIHLALSTSQLYLPWAATSLRSIFDRHPREGIVTHVLHEGLPPADTERLQRIAHDEGRQLHLHHIDDERIRSLALTRSFGSTVWLKCLLPEVLPSLDRVVFLDADTLVTDVLDPLWSTDLAGSMIGAVANVVEPGMMNYVRSIGIRDPRHVLNSGILLMDLAAMRREDLTTTVLRLAGERAAELRWADQDALNIVLEDRWFQLHPRWNAQNSFWVWEQLAAAVFGDAAVREAKDSPAIVHFEGPSFCKPWHNLCTHPWRNEYRRTLWRTPWSDVPIEDRTPLTQMLRLLPEAWRIAAYLRLRGSRALK